MMGRIDWLRGVYTVFSQAVLAIALEIWVNLEVKRRMGRMDWADGRERNGGEGCGGSKCYLTFLMMILLFSDIFSPKRLIAARAMLHRTQRKTKKSEIR